MSKEVLNLVYKHVGEGKFIVEMEDGTFKDLGPNAVGMIRYTYFEDYQIPKVGWEVTRGKLLEDYQPKVMKDMIERKIKPKQR